ncbi:30S ribosomal protein S11 [Candidatus Woesearchaeota archaeon CG10_big_fil_rev_8_21_14_0_10_34_12]|nr:MAG: 30S ribosomal protein S11 [Candidatus Woesearchaeota archaeon CG10_big_fil_rev_8_21_14_0_10_34_12]
MAKKNKEEQEINGEESLNKDLEKLEKIVEEVKEERKTERGLKKIEKTGIVNIFTSFNNTIVHITDLVGNSISRVSGGMMTKHDRLKANPTVAMFVAKRAAEVAKDKGIENVYVRIRAKTNSPGLGPGAHAAVKSLGREKMKIINILDVTKIPRGGPKKKGGKRGRRV